jgi:hypothetical protein
MTTNESDSLGRLAEQEFSTWATRGGITVNKVDVDRHGWDFILQIPYRNEDRSGAPSLDKLGPELTCKIQIKATEQSKDSCDEINLENWCRMVSEPIPWFIVILIYESRHVKEAYLVHVDERLMARALTRLRQVTDSDRNMLHKKYMSLKWSESDRIEFPFENGLVRRIKSSMERGLNDYVEKKKRLYQTLGYDDKTAQGIISFQAPIANDRTSLWSALADHAIGISPNMPVSMIDVNEVRFGISKHVPSASGKPDECRIEDPKVDTGQISFHNKSQSAKFVQIDCNFYHAGVVFPFLPQEYHRVRIQTKFFSIVIDPLDQEQMARIHILLKPAQEESIAELVKYARFISICSSGTNGGVFFMLSLTKSKINPDKECYIANSNFPEEVLQTARTIERLWDVMRFFDIDSDTKVNLAEIWNQTETIEFFSTATNMANSSPTSLITFKSDKNLRDQQVAVVYGSYIVLGGLAIVIIVSFIGTCRSIVVDPEVTDTQSDKDMHCYGIHDARKELSHHEKYRWQNGTTIPLRDMLEQICQDLSKQVFCVMAPQAQRVYISEQIF